MNNGHIRKKIVILLLSLGFFYPASPFIANLAAQDELSFEIQREKMTIKIFKTIEYSSELIKKAFLTVPRHLYTPKHYQSMAYTNNPIPLSGAAVIPSPQILAEILSEANLTPTSKVLIAGSGTGYSVMLLHQIVREVYVADASFSGAIPEGVYVSRATSPTSWAHTAPFDFIFIHTAVNEISPEIIDMLKTGGILAAPLLDNSGIQTIIILKKTNNGTIIKSKGSAIFSTP